MCQNYLAQVDSIIKIKIVSNSFPSVSGSPLNYQKVIVVSGCVYSETVKKENVISFATINVKGTKIYCTTNNLGFYSLDITNIVDSLTEIKIVVKFISYKTVEVLIKDKISQSIDFILFPKASSEFDAVEIKQKKRGK